MFQVSYRKYRPRFFKDVYGQENITSVLSKEVAEGTFGHAYLFTGSRGIGKTTCAKILAKAVNCPNEKDGEPCGVCPICTGIDDGSLLDITEMDAASNRNIDDIRGLRSEANFTPAVAKYRVYIIDEAHMLTKEAANALLKIMEEPPEHVIFILATTEVHKLPATILSRCLRFDFKRIPPEVIAERVKFVCKEEEIEIEDAAAELIGRLADGGMRDALSLLDICRGAGEKITAETVGKCAGLAGREYLYELAGLVAKGDAAGVLECVDKLYADSADVTRLCDELIGHYRNLMVVSCTKDASGILKVLPDELERLKAQAAEFTQSSIFYGISLLQDTLVKMSRTSAKRTELELALIKLCSPELSKGTDALVARIEKLENEIKLLKAGAVPVQRAQKEKPVAVKAEQTEQTEKTLKSASAVKAENEPQEGESPFGEWDEALAVLKKNDPMLSSLLGGSTAFISGSRVLIDADNDSFIPYINSRADAKESIKTAIAQVTGVKYAIGPHKKAETPDTEDPLLRLQRIAEENGIKGL